MTRIPWDAPLSGDYSQARNPQPSRVEPGRRELAAPFETEELRVFPARAPEEARVLRAVSGGFVEVAP